MNLSDEFKRQAISLYFKTNSPVKQQLDSYNRFVQSRAQEIIDRFGVIETNVPDFQLKLGKIRFEKPTVIEANGVERSLYPWEARIRNLTYKAPIFLEMAPVREGVQEDFVEVFIGELPVMVRSQLCYLDGMSEDELLQHNEDPFDPGGYFIINGTERVLISLEDLVGNRILTTKEGKEDMIISKVFSSRYTFRARCAVLRTKDGRLFVEFPSSVGDVRLTWVLRYFGLETNEDIINAFTDNPLIKNDLLYNLEEDTTSNAEEALDEISKKVAPGQPKEYRHQRTIGLLDNYLLPHLGIDANARKIKAQFLIKMAERSILAYHGKIPKDDKDHYMNKRVKLSGELMEELFNSAFQAFVKDVAYQATRAAARGRRLIPHVLVRPEAFNEKINYSMATGNWVAKQKGVSQVLDRTSFLSSMSQLRRVVSPLSKTHPHFEARDLHGTHYGRICASETPEGPNCSLVKNLALYAQVTTGFLPEEDEALMKVLKEAGLEVM